MGTRFESPRPPDYDGSSERCIEFGYDPHTQGFTAVQEDWQPNGARLRRVIMVLPDRWADDHRHDIETIMSWGLPVDVKPRLPDDHPYRMFACRTYYPLPATKMVLNLLKRMDYSQHSEMHDKVRALFADLHARGYKFMFHDAPKSEAPHLIVPPTNSFCLVK